ncbi:MAG TPA: 50S ribosomal protein L6 [Anaerolineae bacterium]|jgi:large subunit ribosomal protein L6|nr:50S ribosomal protein L6 [Anaerolineae bacterium]
MSRIGKKPVLLPAGVQVKINGSDVHVKGPKGELTRSFHAAMTIALNGNEMTVSRPDDLRQNRALHGLTRALLNNMVEGVTRGFKKTLMVEGVGYRAEFTGKRLMLYLGYSHPIMVVPPDGITIEADPKAKTISIAGIDKEKVGEIAAEIRSLRPPEPYKGKGIRYSDEVVRRKAGKAGKVGG